MTPITPITDEQIAIMFSLYRVSFRLSFAALFCDIGYSGHLLANLFYNTPGFFCGYIIWATVFFLHTSTFLIRHWFLRLSKGSSGLLNALVFSQDIAVTRAFQAIKLRWWITNVNFYESHYPHRSHNKSIRDAFGTQGKSNDFVELQTLNHNNSDITKKWLRYMLLIKLFSPPKNSSLLISSKHSLSTNSSNADKPNATSLLGKDYFKNYITLNNQNDDQDIHLYNPEPVHLNDPSQYSSLSSDLLTGNYRTNQINQTYISKINNANGIDISNCAVDDDEGRMDVVLVNYEPTKRISGFTKIFSSDIDLPREIETFEPILKML
ncbi:3374_t:CDS:2 [Cetraspora pellucida]|uniref:3374_t:CDS:1 n=1 Tax=Cetraspora pellucida TaxID=1433469 RepID=A0A9N9N658_9GLOM|nr:3374_t:CDS:2 [Cetraspora pellucida]